MTKINTMIAITIMAVVMSTGVAQADTKKDTTTFKGFISAWASVPGAVANHVKAEWEDIKVYQKDSWNSTTSKLTGFFSKFPKADNKGN